MAGTVGNCPHCGTKIILPGGQSATTGSSEKKILPAFLLCLFFGALGIHAFYAGRLRRGLLYLAFPLAMLVMGLVVVVQIEANHGTVPETGFVGFMVIGMWLAGITAAVMVVVDFIQIIVGSFRDGDGKAIAAWT